jgi:hypothetical protein
LGADNLIPFYERAVKKNFPMPVGELRVSVIAQALKAGRVRSIVDVTGKQVDFNQ